MHVHRNTILNSLARLFFLWIIYQYALGGWEIGWLILTHIGLPAWIALALVVALVFYHGDYRMDVPLFIAAYALGYWGEWWGTTRGVWTYSNGQTPPDYLPPLWAIGLLTVTHLRALFNDMGLRLTRMNADVISLSAFICVRPRPIFRRLKILLLVTLPGLAFVISAPRLIAVEWSGRLDAHFVAGIIAGIALLLFRFDVDESFELFVCGMILGGTYEWLGTTIGEWTYITHEVPPWWIIPLWGLACVAMVNLSRLLILGAQKIERFTFQTPHATQ